MRERRQNVFIEKSWASLFPVKQNNKVRPIEDYKENMVNQSVTQSEGVTKLQCSHQSVVSMVAYWLSASQKESGRSDLKAKCWDFSDACNQIPISDQAFEKPVWRRSSNSECCRPGPLLQSQHFCEFADHFGRGKSFARVNMVR